MSKQRVYIADLLRSLSIACGYGDIEMITNSTIRTYLYGCTYVPSRQLANEIPCNENILFRRD